MKDKIFVLDTSAIISLVQDITTVRSGKAPGFAGVLGDNEIIIPRVVIDELDGLRKSGGDRSKAASEAARQLENYCNAGTLIEGVETEKGGLLRIVPRPTNQKLIALELTPGVADHEILVTAIEIEDSLKAENRDAEVKLITCLLYTSPSPRDRQKSRMPSSA